MNEFENKPHYGIGRMIKDDKFTSGRMLVENGIDRGVIKYLSNKDQDILLYLYAGQTGFLEYSKDLGISRKAAFEREKRARKRLIRLLQDFH